MKNIKYLFLAMVSVLIGFASCEDKETSLSRAVLSSAKVLEYEVLPVGSQTIIITSDADWYAETPEWVTVSPSNGHAGQTEVEITVTDNLRDGTPDNPRKANILFKGRNLEGTAKVLISQFGDKYRDPVDYTISSLGSIEDETVVRLPSLSVMSVTANGIMATDGTDIICIKEISATRAVEMDIKPGDTVSVIGDKMTDALKMIYVIAGKVESEGNGETPALTPVDITSTFDATDSKTYQYVSVTGVLAGNMLTITDMTCKAQLIDVNPDLGMDALTGHKVTVAGFTAGMAAPVLNIIPTSFEDLGLNMVTLFFEDFEWIAPYAIAGKDGNTPAGDTVGTNGKTSEAPKADAAKVNGKTCTQALMEKGYDFVSAHDFNKADGARDFALYLQQNYLKFNKTGNVGGKPYQEGLVLPALDNVPEGVSLKISFDWCPQMQGDGMYDKTEMAVIVVNGDSQEEIVAPGHTRPDGSAYSWQNADLDLSGVKIDKNTKLIIRNSNAAWGDKTAHRFYLDNIRIYYLP